MLLSIEIEQIVVKCNNANPNPRLGMKSCVENLWFCLNGSLEMHLLSFVGIEYCNFLIYLDGACLIFPVLFMRSGLASVVLDRTPLPIIIQV